MSDPALDLFGEPIAEEPAAPASEPAAKPPGKRAKPAVVILPPEPPRAPLPTPAMGPTEGAPPRPAKRQMPRYEVRPRRDGLRLPCFFCQEPTAWTVRVVRPWDTHELSLCERCRGSAPAEAEGPLAGPWVVIWLREAGLIPWLPRKGTLG